MLGVTSPWTFLLGTIAIILLPGPNTLYVLSVAARSGVRTGYRAAVGVWIGDATLMTLSAGGVASLMYAYPALFVVVKYAGAAYLAYVGIRLVVGAWRSRRSLLGDVVPPAGTGDVRTPTERPLRKALIISLLNPKAILFFVSFFVQFVDPAYAYPALSFLVLGAVTEVISLAYLTVLILLGRYVANRLRDRHRLSTGLNTGVGALFVGFGVKLAASAQ